MICVCVYMWICVYVYMCTCVYVYMCRCTYVYMYIGICVYVYMFTCVHIYIYIFTCDLIVTVLDSWLVRTENHPFIDSYNSYIDLAKALWRRASKPLVSKRRQYPLVN